MEIKPGKWRTANGCQAVVLEQFEDGLYGRVRRSDGVWHSYNWKISGRAYENCGSSYDLIAPWEEPKSRPRVCLCPSGALYLLLERDAVALGYVLVPELDALFEKGKE